MYFIELTSRESGKKVTFNLSSVLRIIEEEEGCFIVTDEKRRGVYGVSVRETYVEVRLKIANVRRLG